jgi:hypothetical protein
MRQEVVSGIRPGFPGLSRSRGQVTHVLLTRSPLIPRPKAGSSSDLHVLSTPPAFVLSQDQTLRKNLRTPRAPPGKTGNRPGHQIQTRPKNTVHATGAAHTAINQPKKIGINKHGTLLSSQTTGRRKPSGKNNSRRIPRRGVTTISNPFSRCQIRQTAENPHRKKVPQTISGAFHKGTKMRTEMLPIIEWDLFAGPLQFSLPVRGNLKDITRPGHVLQIGRRRVFRLPSGAGRRAASCPADAAGRPGAGALHRIWGRF